jgi:hypothetical protein
MSARLVTHAKMSAMRTNGNRRMGNSQTVTMDVTPTGLTKPQYTSTPISLIGGEVRTALIMDTQLTSNPPVQVSMADDAGPAN